jgi:hypothetical protein
MFKSNGLNLMVNNCFTSFLFFFFEIYIVNVLLCTELFKKKFKY